MITKSLFRISGTVIVLLLCAASAIAQSKIEISIIKNHNGEIEEFTREIEIAEGQDLGQVLAETDIWKEFSNVQEGETYEINIVKLKGNEEVEHLNLFIGDDYEISEEKAFLGVMLKEVKSEPGDGVLISTIIEGTAAEESELRAGDILLEIDKEEVNSIEDITRAIRSHEPGDKIKIKYERDGKKSRTKITLGKKPNEFLSRDFDRKRGHHRPDRPPHPPKHPQFEMPEAPEPPEIPEIHIFTPDSADAPQFWKEKDSSFLGITPGKDMSEGVDVGTIVEGSAAENMGLQPRDAIVTFNGKEVKSFDHLAEIIRETSPGDEVELTVNRKGQTVPLSGEMGKRKFSEAKHYRMYRDFLGRDEDGTYQYEFQFDADTMDMEKLKMEFEKEMEEYHKNMEGFEKEMEELDEEMERLEVEMTIEVMKITDEDVERVNAKSGDKKLFKESTLGFESIELFPNPSNGKIRLAFETSQSGDNLEILVFNPNGKIVFRELIPEFEGSYQNVIDISEQASGNYFLQIMLGDKVYSRKLMKQ